MSLPRQRLLARFYDPFAATGLREDLIAPQMLRLVGPSPRRILHVGCGRGWLTRLFASQYPECEVIGVDCDEDVLAGAVDHTPETFTNIAYVLGRAEEPPVEGPFDAIVSSLLLHHLPRAAKRAALTASARLLAPKGRLLIADFGRPHDRVMRSMFVVVQLAHGFDDTSDNVEGTYPELMAGAGLSAPAEIGRWRSPLGSVALYQAHVPVPPA